MVEQSSKDNFFEIEVKYPDPKFDIVETFDEMTLSLIHIGTSCHPPQPPYTERQGEKDEDMKSMEVGIVQEAGL